jgi:hypothetical protein
VERAIEVFACINFVIIGLSHVVQPKIWVAFFVVLREKGLAGVFLNGFLTLSFGSLIVAFHNVWTWPGVVVTLIGWGQVVKALLSFVAPQLAMRGLQRVALERAWEFQVPGAMLLGLGVLMAYLLAS